MEIFHIYSQAPNVFFYWSISETEEDCLCHLSSTSTCFESVSAKQNGQNPLHVAAENDNRVCTAILIKSGARKLINAVDNNGLTPLEISVLKKNCGPIKTLIEEKANMDFLYAKDQAFVNQCMINS